MTGNIVGGTANLEDVVLNCKNVGAPTCNFTTQGQPEGTFVTKKLTGTSTGAGTISLGGKASTEWATMEGQAQVWCQVGGRMS